MVTPVTLLDRLVRPEGRELDTTADVVRRLWGLCNALRDDGISYHEYLSELTTLLFLKLAEELSLSDALGDSMSWARLSEQTDDHLLTFYRSLLRAGGKSKDDRISGIFGHTTTQIKSGHSLRRIIDAISDIAWYKGGPNAVGNIYEGLIEKNASESRYGAGQYFTPRALVDAMVAVTKPTPDDVVYDPAAGTAGFLVTAAAKAAAHGPPPTIVGRELVPTVHRMALMNILLHGFGGKLELGDTLSSDPDLISATLCLSNPPFGVRGNLTSDQQTRLHFPTSNKQLAFLQHIYQSLVNGGRAAVVIPDNVLFESGIAASIRGYLLDNFNVHTVLRLPPGIFYATGVRTSVLFFSKTAPTKTIWTYDLRSTTRSFTKKRQLTADDLAAFIVAYGSDPLGNARRRAKANVFYPTPRSALKSSGHTLDIPPPKPDQIGPQVTPEAMIELLVDELESALVAAREISKLISATTSENDI